MHRLHARYSAGLLRFFAKRTAGNLEWAEELAQQTWAEVWRALVDQRYDPKRAAMSTFIYAIGQNLWLRARRSAMKSRPASFEAELLLGNWLAPGADLSQSLAAAELLTALRDCVAKDAAAGGLSDVEARVVRGLMDGLTERQIAAQLGVAPSTAHTWKQAALKNLGRCLAARGFALESPEQPGRTGE